MSWDNTSPALNTLVLTPSNTAPSPASVPGFVRPVVAFAASTANVTPFPTFDLYDNTFDNGGSDGVAGKTAEDSDHQLFLLKNQTDKTHNGLWTWDDGTFVRSTIPLVTGLQVGVEFGAENAGSLYELTTEGTIVPETTELTFVLVGEGTFPAVSNTLP